MSFFALLIWSLTVLSTAISTNLSLMHSFKIPLDYLLTLEILRIVLQQQHLLEKINMNLSHTEQNFSPFE